MVRHAGEPLVRRNLDDAIGKEEERGEKRFWSDSAGTSRLVERVFQPIRESLAQQQQKKKQKRSALFRGVRPQSTPVTRAKLTCGDVKPQRNTTPTFRGTFGGASQPLTRSPAPRGHAGRTRTTTELSSGRCPHGLFALVNLENIKTFMRVNLGTVLVVNSCDGTLEPDVTEDKRQTTS